MIPVHVAPERNTRNAVGDEHTMAITIHFDGFSERFTQLAHDYYETTGIVPPQCTSSTERMNSLLRGTKHPTMRELIAISEGYDVSINYLVNGDELFPSIHQLEKKDAKRILDEIEDHFNT